MFGDLNLTSELIRLRKASRQEEDQIVSEVKKILHEDLFTEKKILENLPLYRRSFLVLDEEDLRQDKIFTLQEIKQVAVLYRLKFLDSSFFKPELPFEVGLKTEELNKRFHKDIGTYKVLSHYENFKNSTARHQAMVFVETNYGNYYLLHSWGKTLKMSRRLQFLPLRSFESLILSVVFITLVLALSLPTGVITLDSKAEYWSGYRAAAFFHLLIFNFGVTVYFTFTFAKNFSNTVWNRYKDF
jgi:hypothetical protein